MPAAAEQTDPSPRPKRKNKPTQLKPRERALRGQLILARKLSGERVADIAKDFRISLDTAYKALDETFASGITAQAKDFVSTRLLPKALAVYDQALDEMNVEVARDVLQGLGLTGRVLKVENTHKVTEDFDTWRLKKAAVLEARVTVISDDANVIADPPTD